MRPVICLVTAPGAAEDRLIDRVGAAARAGVHLLQIRQPHLEGRALARLVERALVAVRGTPARVIVNERLDVALAAGAHGVHLRADAMPAPRARAVAPPGFVIGRSVHSADDAEAAARGGGLDYLLFGTVFATASKPDRAAAGLDALAAACARVPLPVLAIGGVTPTRLGAVAAAGAAGFAAIGLFAAAAIEEIAPAVEHAMSVFDTPWSVP